MTERELRFQRLFEAHHMAILGYLGRRVEQPADAADLLADVFLTAWRRLDTVPSGDPGRMWLFGVARRTMLNYRRGRLRRQRLADQLREQLDGGAGWDATEHNVVRDCLAHVSVTDREVLTLTVWEGLTPSEIATILHVPAGAVRVRRHRARRRLRRLLELAELGEGAVVHRPRANHIAGTPEPADRPAL
ncbi:MAG: RNA polymerase sigma factor [Candidatus Dormibacteria bacterium]